MTDCYLCSKHYTKIPGVGRKQPWMSLPGISLGICRICSIKACQDHATRDPNKPGWICVLCEANLLSVSGITYFESYQPESPGIITVLAGLVSSAMIEDARAYHSLGSFLESRPEYQFMTDEIKQILESARSRFITKATGELWESLDESGQQLIAAAIAIAIHFDIHDEDMGEILRILVTVWRGWHESHSEK